MTRIRTERLRLGWTQVHLACVSGVKLAQIRKFEQHPEIIPKASYETVKKLADALRISVEEVVSS